MLRAAMLEGLPPNNAAHLLRLACDETTARRIADAIVETFDPFEAAAAAFEQAPSTRDWRQGPWMVEAYFGAPPDEAKLCALIAAVAGQEAAKELVFDRVAQRDWVASSLEGLQPVRAGRFIIHGAHGRGAARASEIGIEIEAALAFGTGHHGSTRGCLTMLERVARRRRPRAILDIGAGSGVLAIAAARLFKRKVHAGDIDPVAVASARVNARRNLVAAFLRPVAARGAEHPDLRQGAPYDLVFANILARPLCDLAPRIGQLAAPSADVILSGLIGRDAPGVTAAYRAQGFALAQRIEIEGWVTLLMRKPPLRGPLAGAEEAADARNGAPISRPERPDQQMVLPHLRTLPTLAWRLS